MPLDGMAQKKKKNQVSQMSRGIGGGSLMNQGIGPSAGGMMNAMRNMPAVNKLGGMKRGGPNFGTMGQGIPMNQGAPTAPQGGFGFGIPQQLPAFQDQPPIPEQSFGGASMEPPPQVDPRQMMQQPRQMRSRGAGIGPRFM
jgi:hypothetical protein